MPNPACTILKFPNARRVPSRRSPRRSKGLVAASHREAANGFKAKADAMRADYDCATCEDGSPFYCDYICPLGIRMEIVERLQSLITPRIVEEGAQ
jgi:hypothetical protein